MNAPTVGQTYTVAVHNYASAAGRTATLRLYCGPFAGATPSVIYTSTPSPGAPSATAPATPGGTSPT